MKKITALSYSLATALVLTGCGGGGGSGDSSTPTPTTPAGTRSLTVTPVLGPTFNADVTIESLDKSFTASGNTSSAGNVTFTIPESVQAVIVSVKGTGSSNYLEEAGDFKEEPLTSGTVFRAALVLSSQAQQDIGVTPLTEAAARYAQKQGFANSTILAANTLVANTFKITDILRRPIVLKSKNDYANLPVDSTNLSASRYSVLLAAISQVAATNSGSSSQASIKFTQQLGNDFEDGNINQSGDAYNSNTLETEINEAVAALPVSAELKSSFTVPVIANGRTLTVTPVLGKTFNTDVLIESLDKSFSATGNTLLTGSVSFKIPDAVQTVIVTVKGNATSKYLEAANDFKDEILPANETLRAALTLTSQAQQDIAVTALTEAAVGFALQQGLSATTIALGNQLVGTALGIPNILLKPVILLNTDGYGTLPTDSANLNASRYTVLLAALSKIAADKSGNKTQASLTFNHQFAGDFEDGDIDQNGQAYNAASLQAAIIQTVVDLPISPILKSTFSTPVSVRTLTVTPMLGQTFNTDVIVESLDKSFAIIGNTASSGSVSFSIPDSVQSAMVTVKGNDNSTYIEEADDFKTGILPDGETLRAAVLLPAQTNKDITVTALTEAAVRYAQKQGLSITTIPSSNQLVNTTFGIPDILLRPAVLNSSDDYATLPSDGANLNASRYAILLAALSQTAANKSGAATQASLTFAHQLANDFSDGNISLNGSAYTASSLQEQVNQIVAGLPVASALQAAFTITTHSDNNGGTTHTGNATASALNDYLGTYTGTDASAQNCTLTLAASGLITLDTATVDFSASMDGGDDDTVIRKNGGVTGLTSGNGNTAFAPLIISIKDAKLLLAYYQVNLNAQAECGNLTKIP